MEANVLCLLYCRTGKMNDFINYKNLSPADLEDESICKVYNTNKERQKFLSALNALLVAAAYSCNGSLSSINADPRFHSKHIIYTDVTFKFKKASDMKKFLRILPTICP
jgi:hypothetical protein